MATALYVPCLAITSATGNEAYLIHSILLLGTVVTVYTLMGGVEGVIWTEVAQFVIMFIGLGITLGVIFWNVEGGFTAIMQDALKVGDPLFHRGNEQSLGLWDSIKAYFVIPIPIFGMIVATMVSRVTNYTSDQVMVQRFQTCKTIKDARAGFVLTAIGDILWMVILIFVGVALFTYFNQIGGIPEWLKDKEDQVFPYFMGKVFPVGLTGLVIAAIFAASLCSLGGAINSVTSVVVIDFYERIYMGRKREEVPHDEAEQRRQVRLSRFVTLAIGIIAVALSCNVSKLGTILEIANKVINSFTGAILGIFLLGMFTRRATSFSVFLGGILGTLMAIYVIFWSSPDLTVSLGITGLFPSGEPISFLWPSTFGLAVTLVVGYFSSLLTAPSGAEIEAGKRWNWFAVTREKLVED
jgi:SSS family transporter